TPTLRLALKADNDGGLLAEILDAYAQEEAALPVRLMLGRFGEQARAVREGHADAALLHSPFDDRGLDSEPLIIEPYLVALAADDPLSARTSLRLADLTGRRLPDGSPANQGPASGRHGDGGTLPHRAGAGEKGTRATDVAQGARATDVAQGALATDPAQDALATDPAQDALATDPAQDALATDAAQDAADLPQIFKLVELGSIVCFFPTSLTLRYPRSEIVYCPVEDLEPAALCVAWPQHSRSTAIAAFVRVAAKVAAQAQAAQVTAPPAHRRHSDRT
ncbi:LysR substrate-binding domain-containing protein, partial [Streptomyces chartreusis]|uniref:LysR substrate-binding domain-containing protein n=1 Tax=Streptomyces chartreusis TaxID=1969 RepID=UPI0036788CC7